MGRRLLALLLAAWFIGLLGCGPSAPTPESKPFKQLRPRMPQMPTNRK
jgi:hypothetical protein